MSLSPQTLSKEYLNLLRNDIIKFEFSPLVYRIIIEWGFEKPDGVTIKEHVENQKIEEKSGIKLGKWFMKHEEKIGKKDFSSFDITFLHEILPVLCYNKFTQDRKEWQERLKDTNSIEYLLNEIKSFRNDVSHEYSKAIEDPNIEAKKDIMRKCIKTAGTLYSKDQSEIDERIAHLESKFDKLVHDTTNSYESAVKNVTDLVEKESAPFMLEKYSKSFSVPLPGGLGKVGIAQIFESVNLSVAAEGEGDSKKTVFSSTEVCNQITDKFVVINGGPGSGKTTLMRYLFQSILENSVNKNEMTHKGLDRFRVPIYLECRTERQNNLRDFLKESIPNFHSPKEVIYDAFKEIRGQVFLIDGYDEVNDDSRKLVGEIIPFCNKYNATCIVSGRIDAGNNFIRDLQERNLSCDEMLIEPISEMSDKVSFLRRYADKMGDEVNSEELVNIFKNLNDAAQRVFFSPVLLALFISLFLNKRKRLSQLHNEQSAYKAIREIFSEDIKKKLREGNVSNLKGKTNDILAVFSYYSLMLFNSEKYFFEEDDHESLIRDCEQKLSKKVDIGRLLTCILTPETSLKSEKALTYAFTHSTIQEYLAVEQINENMRNCEIDWSSEQLSEDGQRKNFLKCLGLPTTRYVDGKEVERYGNIIKLLILETLSIGELTKYTKTFSAVLRKYFIPKNDDDYPVCCDYLFDLVSSSNCESIIVSIVANAMRDESGYHLNYNRHIRPMTEILKMRQTRVKINSNLIKYIPDTDVANLVQLVSVLKDDSEICLNFKHSYDNYQPLNGEIYTQLKNSKCKVTEFSACIKLSERLSSLMRVYTGSFLRISTPSPYDVSFATLEEHRELYLRVKYTDDCPRTGSNPVPGDTSVLTIVDIPVDGRENVYNIIKFLCPKSKQFQGIFLDSCHLIYTDANELLKQLAKEKIRTNSAVRLEVEISNVNEDLSKKLCLHLPDTGKIEANQQEAEQRAALIQAAIQQAHEQREAAEREGVRREDEQRECH